MGQFLVYFGIVAYAIIVFSVLTGMRYIKVKFKYHKWIGLTGLGIASIHALGMAYYSFF